MTQKLSLAYTFIMNKLHNDTFNSIFNDNISITDDFMFYSVMQNPLLCKEVLTRLLPFPIQDIQYVEPQKTLAFAHDSKSVRLMEKKPYDF